jgi:acetylglutamate kinase
MVLGGLVNKEIVTLITKHGGKAAGLSGKDGRLISAKKKTIKTVTPETGTDEIIDIGLVGEVAAVEPDILESLEKDGFIPVISPIGVGPKGETLNINADFVAAAVASSVEAEKLILLTDVPGVLDKKGNVISSIRQRQVHKLIKNKTITEGMLPKIQACLNVLRNHKGKAHIIDGRVPHCLLLEIFTKTGIGTEIVH